MFVRMRPKINLAYVIIGVAGFIMLVALLSAPRVRKYAREKARTDRSPSTANSTQRP